MDGNFDTNCWPYGTSWSECCWWRRTIWHSLVEMQKMGHQNIIPNFWKVGIFPFLISWVIYMNKILEIYREFCMIGRFLSNLWVGCWSVLRGLKLNKIIIGKTDRTNAFICFFCDLKEKKMRYIGVMASFDLACCIQYSYSSVRMYNFSFTGMEVLTTYPRSTKNSPIGTWKHFRDMLLVLWFAF